MPWPTAIKAEYFWAVSLVMAFLAALITTLKESWTESGLSRWIA
jgi:hypothetical protein